MKIRDLIGRLMHFDQECEVEFLTATVHYLCPERLSLGSVYDNTDALYTPADDVVETPTIVTLEFDVLTGLARGTIC